MTHTVLTFIARVKPEKVASLGVQLEQIKLNPENNVYVPFRQLRLLHFASFVLHESQDYGAYLVFENNFDGMLDPYLDDLYRVASNGLHQIYSSCWDYTVANAGDQQGLLAYLKAHVVRPNAYHIGNVGRSAERIGKEQTLRDALETHADGLGQGHNPDRPSGLLGALQKIVQSNPDFAWVAGVGPRQTFLQRFVPYLKLVLAVLLAIVLLPIWLLPAIVLILDCTESVLSLYRGSGSSTWLPARPQPTVTSPASPVFILPIGL